MKKYLLLFSVASFILILEIQALATNIDCKDFEAVSSSEKLQEEIQNFCSQNQSNNTNSDESIFWQKFGNTLCQRLMNSDDVQLQCRHIQAINNKKLSLAQALAIYG